MALQELIFERSALRLADCPKEPWPEVAISGRSNVGKSSLLNRIAGRKALAKVSQTPGKTRTLNFFRFEVQARLVDLPGYGFARVPPAMQDEWRRCMSEYLAERAQLAGIIQIVDSRHAPTELDQQMVGWMRHRRLPFLLVLTKADKIKRGERAKAKAEARRSLELPADQACLFFSAETGEGKREVLSWIAQALAGWRPDPLS